MHVCLVRLLPLTHVFVRASLSKSRAQRMKSVFGGPLTYANRPAPATDKAPPSSNQSIQAPYRPMTALPQFLIKQIEEEKERSVSSEMSSYPSETTNNADRDDGARNSLSHNPGALPGNPRSPANQHKTITPASDTTSLNSLPPLGHKSNMLPPMHSSPLPPKPTSLAPIQSSFPPVHPFSPLTQSSSSPLPAQEHSSPTPEADPLLLKPLSPSRRPLPSLPKLKSPNIALPTLPTLKPSNNLPSANTLTYDPPL